MNRLVKWLSVLILLSGMPLLLAAEVDYEAIVAEIVSTGEDEISQYRPENGLDTADLISDLYFDVFEGKGMEKDLAMRDPERKTTLESYFSAVTGHATTQADRVVVEKAWNRLKQALQQAAAEQGSTSGFWTTLIQAFLILTREGFEAILVITALVTYLQRTAPEQVRVIWHGVGWALVASLATAWLLTSVYKLSGADREAMEGGTMLIAAAVLFYVSYWMISKREADKWQQFIHHQINQAVYSGSAWALGFAAFLAVYREGAETVLFYQALIASASGENSAIAAGFGAAAVTLVAIYYTMRKASVRLPISTFFTFTAVLLYYLAFTFIGNGVLELQEAKWIAITPLDGLPRMGLLGFNPTLEGAMAQLLFLLPLPYAFYVLLLKPRRLREQEATSA